MKPTLSVLFGSAHKAPEADAEDASEEESESSAYDDAISAFVEAVAAKDTAAAGKSLRSAMELCEAGSDAKE